MSMKNIVIAATLALSVAAAAFAEEPNKAPAAPGAPAAATAPAAAGGAPAVAAPAAPAPAPAAPLKKEVKANKAITISMFLVIIGITSGRRCLGRQAHEDGLRLLRRRRRHHRHPERLGHCRRLHVRRLVPGDFRDDLPVRV